MFFLILKSFYQFNIVNKFHEFNFTMKLILNSYLSSFILFPCLFVALIKFRHSTGRKQKTLPIKNFESKNEINMIEICYESEVSGLLYVLVISLLDI